MIGEFIAGIYQGTQHLGLNLLSVWMSAYSEIIAPKSIALTLPARSGSLTLETRSGDLTLTSRSLSLTLPERD